MASIVLFLLVVAIVSPTLTFSRILTDSRLKAVEDAVKLVTYVESLCPYSIEFIRDQLDPTYSELKDVMDVDIVVYGKVTETPNAEGGYDFVCQHGIRECNGNVMLACARNYITDHLVYIDFAICAMKDVDPPTSGQKCADAIGIDFSVIDACRSSTEGQLLLHEVGLIQATQQDPPVTFVPFIIINDVFSDENQDAAQTDLKTLVCATYTGTAPSSCSFNNPHIQPRVTKLE